MVQQGFVRPFIVVIFTCNQYNIAGLKFLSYSFYTFLNGRIRQPVVYIISVLLVNIINILPLLS